MSHVQCLHAICCFYFSSIWVLQAVTLHFTAQSQSSPSVLVLLVLLGLLLFIFIFINIPKPFVLTMRRVREYGRRRWLPHPAVPIGPVPFLDLGQIAFTPTGNWTRVHLEALIPIIFGASGFIFTEFTSLRWRCEPSCLWCAADLLARSKSELSVPTGLTWLNKGRREIISILMSALQYFNYWLSANVRTLVLLIPTICVGLCLSHAGLWSSQKCRADGRHILEEIDEDFREEVGAVSGRRIWLICNLSSELCGLFQQIYLQFDCRVRANSVAFKIFELFVGAWCLLCKLLTADGVGN